jgi:hypothetical protein
MKHHRTTPTAATAGFAPTAFFFAAAPGGAQAPDASAPTGAVGGLRSPAKGTLELSLAAHDKGWGLASAEASLGPHTTFTRLGQGSCPEHPAPGGPEPAPGDCPASVSAAPLELDTRAVPDGTHRLVVRVTDAAANTATLLDREITVRNAAVVTGTRASLQLGVSSQSPDSPGKGKGKGKGKGPGAGKGLPPCRWPRLRMRLLARPLWRTRPGRLPVLRFKKRHLYRGHLTCRVGNKRVRAPEGTPVAVVYRIWRRSFRKRRAPITVRKGQIRVRNGRLRVRLGFLSGRTVLFSYLSPEGGAARSKLRIAIARTDPPRRGQ